MNRASIYFFRNFAYETRDDKMSTIFLFGAALLFSVGILLMVGAVLNWHSITYHYMLAFGLALSIISILLIKLIMSAYPVKREIPVLKFDSYYSGLAVALASILGRLTGALIVYHKKFKQQSQMQRLS